MKKLRAEFIKATIEYKASLQKLSAIYENEVRMAKEKIELSQKLHDQGLISMSQVDESKRTLATEKDNLEQTKHKIENADRQIAELPTDEDLIKEYNRARLARKRTKPAKTCSNWDIVASRRESANSLSFTYRIVCR